MAQNRKKADPVMSPARSKQLYSIHKLPVLAAIPLLAAHLVREMQSHRRTLEGRQWKQLPAKVAGD